mmetsp:Transcript_26266/g.23242  ORF Transcript_26266/g.23242 Transcript_26266/m.23242 type:complete len:110 (-) Transcript_26266:57-386(-)
MIEIPDLFTISPSQILTFGNVMCYTIITTNLIICLVLSYSSICSIIKKIKMYLKDRKFRIKKYKVDIKDFKPREEQKEENSSIKILHKSSQQTQNSNPSAQIMQFCDMK